jgi:site-specific recombinase XerD
MDYRSECPRILSDFLSYHENVRGHSQNTVDEYFLDLRGFFRYLKILRHLVPPDTKMDDISILDIDLTFVQTVSLGEIYDYLTHLSRDEKLNNASRARKVSTLRSFFKYLSVKTHQLAENPVEGLDSPKVKKDLPRYLTLDESMQLLESVDGENAERDYCILTLFLNCGLRISELVALNLIDIHGGTIRVLGKGNKERILYLNESCKLAIQDWLIIRNGMTLIDQEALFVTSRKTRITRAGVHKMVKKRLLEAGLNANLYSAHKLRHTAATLMLQNGVDVRTLQEVLGHDHLNTTQIYTHVDNENLRIAAKANPLSKVHRPHAEQTDAGLPDEDSAT